MNLSYSSIFEESGSKDLYELTFSSNTLDDRFSFWLMNTTSTVDGITF
jgi:hypothetical protein